MMLHHDAVVFSLLSPIELTHVRPNSPHEPPSQPSPLTPILQKKRNNTIGSPCRCTLLVSFDLWFLLFFLLRAALDSLYRESMGTSGRNHARYSCCIFAIILYDLFCCFISLFCFRISSPFLFSYVFLICIMFSLFS